MNKIKVMTVVGTRPEAIKMAPVLQELAKCKMVDSRISITAQHRQMLDQVLELFRIHPHHDLNIMQERQSLVGITQRVLGGIDEILKQEKPDIVLVHGDTTTSLASALAAFYNQIKIGHVEAGLRTFNKYFPFPEEMNRKITGSLADLHFSPTLESKNNLLREGVNEKSIFITGNTVIDALATTIQKNYKFQTKILNRIDYKNRKVILVTAHRRENWGKGLENICRALKKIVVTHPEVELVYLVHLNPLVIETADKYLKGVERVHLLSPLDTRETHNLMNRCYLVMTDSGGLQEEAPHLGKPVLVLRDVTERPEAVRAGTVKLVGTDYQKILRNANELIEDQQVYYRMSHAVNPYGDGKAAPRILQVILYSFGCSKKKPKEFIGIL